MHLGLALCSPLGINLLGDWQRAYGTLTGASADFKFFAPRVGAPLQAVFEITDDDGKVSTEGLGEANRELALRVGNIVDAFGEDLADEKLRRDLASSLAVWVSRRHPDLQALRVRLLEFQLPTLKEFRYGKRSYWKELYLADFRAGES